MLYSQASPFLPYNPENAKKHKLTCCAGIRQGGDTLPVLPVTCYVLCPSALMCDEIFGIVSNCIVECLELCIGLKSPASWKERSVLGETAVQRGRHIEGERHTPADEHRANFCSAIPEHSVATCLHATRASPDQHSLPSNPQDVQVADSNVTSNSLFSGS